MATKYTRRLQDSRNGQISYACEGCGAQYTTTDPQDAYRAALQCAHGHIDPPREDPAGPYPPLPSLIA